MILSKFQEMSKHGGRPGDLRKTLDMWYISGICNLRQSACAQLGLKVVILATATMLMKRSIFRYVRCVREATYLIDKEYQDGEYQDRYRICDIKAAFKMLRPPGIKV